MLGSRENAYAPPDSCRVLRARKYGGFKRTLLSGVGTFLHKAIALTVAADTPLATRLMASRLV